MNFTPKNFTPKNFISSFTSEIGGKNVYGASVGILMLESQFPRIVGDMGNAYTWSFPVQYKIVRGATPDRVVRNQPQDLLPDFIFAAQELIDLGVSGITTNCGFLAILQQEFQAALDVPVAASSLMQIPLVQALLPKGKTVGIITINKDSLSVEHLAAVGVQGDIPIVGTQSDGELTTKILDDALVIDFAQARLEMLAAARTMVQNYPQVGAVVLECTNMMPFAAEVRHEIGMPVFTMASFVQWFQSGLEPFQYPYPRTLI